MKPSIAAKLEQLARRLDEVNGLLSSEGATRDLDQFKRLSREHAEITPVVTRYQEHRAAEADLAAAEGMAADPGMKSFAEDEAKSASSSGFSYRATRTTSAISSSRSAPARAAMNRPSSPAISSACTRATRSAGAGRSR